MKHAVFSFGSNSFGQCGKNSLLAPSCPNPNLLIESDDGMGISSSWESTYVWGKGRISILEDRAHDTDGIWLMVWGWDELSKTRRLPSDLTLEGERGHLPTYYEIPREISEIKELKPARGKLSVVILDSAGTVYLLSQTSDKRNDNTRNSSTSSSNPKISTGESVFAVRVASSVANVQQSGDFLFTLSVDGRCTLSSIDLRSGGTTLFSLSPLVSLRLLRTFSIEMSGLVAGPHHALLLPKSKNEAPLALRLGAVGGLHGQLGDGGVVSGPFNPQTEDPREIEALAGVDLPRCAAGGLFSVWSDNNGELYASGKHSLGTARKQAWWEGRSHGRDEKVAQDEDQSDATIPCLVRGPLDEPVDLIACGEHMTAVVLASDRKENKARVWWKGMGMEMERNTSQNEGTWQPVDLGKERGAVSGISCGDGTGWHVVVRVIKET